jgi:hypothetical protein
MAVIKVPKTPKKAFDPDRRISDLLRRQVEHLEWAVRPAAKRKPGMLPKRAPRTEGEAAARIEKLTAAVLEQARKDAETAAAPGGFAAAAPTVPAAVEARPRTRRATAKRSTSSRPLKRGATRSKRRPR